MDAPLEAAQLALQLGPGLEGRWLCLGAPLRTGRQAFLSAGALGAGHYGSNPVRALSGVPAPSSSRAGSQGGRESAGALSAIP